jgi:hypothetical protein
MIYIVDELTLQECKTTRPDQVSQCLKFDNLPHLPRIGEILRFPNYMGGSGLYYIVTGVLHDLADSDDVDTYLVIKCHETPQSY